MSPTRSASPPPQIPPPPQPRPESEMPVFDDGDSVNIPAPSREVLLRTKPQIQKQHLYQSMWLRRTLVPILLTNGVMLPVLGGLWFMTDAESPFRNMGTGLPITLFTLGGVLLLLGLMNVMHLKHVLKK